METKKLILLFNRYVENRCSAEEVELLVLHFQTNNAKLLNQLVKEELQKELAIVDGEVAKVFTAVEKVHQKLKEAILLEKRPAKTKSITLKIWSRITVAAAVAAIVFGIWFYNTQYIDGSRTEFGTGSTNYTNDVKPGSNKAILTLANGKTINLSDAKTGIVINASSLRYNDNTFVIQSESEGSGSLGTRDDKRMRNGGKEAVMLTVSTPRGGTYEVVLPDGTRVWLNAASTLKFPGSFVEGQKRVVELSGEGYFEVAKDKAHAFIVVSDKQEVEVLGTHFNINSYADEGSIKTTLLEGRVRVSALAEKMSTSAMGKVKAENGMANGQSEKRNYIAVLKPGEQSSLYRDQINVTETNTEKAIAWKNGFFEFENASMDEVMRQISRWYDIEVEYVGEIPKSRFDGKLYRNLKLSKVLDALRGFNVNFKMEEKKIIIEK